MDLDCRGDIGFPEAMAGTVTVCIVLMAFSASVFGMVAGGSTDSASVMPDDFHGFLFTEGKIVWNEPEDLEITANRYGVAGISIEVVPLVSDAAGSGIWNSAGYTETGMSTSRLIVIESDDGRKMPSIIRVAVC